MLFMQATPLAFDLARASAGKSMPAKIAIIAMTTSNSINVNPCGVLFFMRVKRGSCAGASPPAR